MTEQNILIDPEFKALIPPLAPEELAQLEANIVKDGCRDPLVTWQGTLIDGHNRHDICTRHGIPFETVEMEFTDRDAVMDWMDANQLGRRNLTNDQRSYLRGRRYNRTKKDAHDGGRGKTRSGEVAEEVAATNTAESIAKQHGVSERTIRSDGKKAEALEKLAKTNPEAAKAVTDGKKRFNEVRREIKLEEVKEAVKLPDAKYRVIYSDPPWKYGDQLTEDYGAIKFHYPAMTITELTELPVKDMVEEDAVLFLWVTSPLLFECAPIIKAWGFSYKTSFVWDKIKHNMGHYNSVRHEFLLICTRGSCTPDAKKLFDSVQSIERTKHSAKPEEFRAIIETLYPHGKKLEMFARSEAPAGWDNWGNQAG
jgi:N6-adenosine-specific RNA methylase IME4